MSSKVHKSYEPRYIDFAYFYTHLSSTEIDTLLKIALCSIPVNRVLALEVTTGL